MQRPRGMGRHVPGGPGQGPPLSLGHSSRALTGSLWGRQPAGHVERWRTAGQRASPYGRPQASCRQLLPGGGRPRVPELGLQKEVPICAGCPPTGSPAATQETHPGVEPSPWPPGYTPVHRLVWKERQVQGGSARALRRRSRGVGRTGSWQSLHLRSHVGGECSLPHAASSGGWSWPASSDQIRVMKLIGS